VPEFYLPKGERRRSLALAAQILASLDELVRWKIVAEPARNDRSPSANAYLWAVPYKMLSEHTGYEADELHEFFCGQVFGWKDKKVPKTPRNPDGITSVPVRTTTTDEKGKRRVLTTAEFSDFVAYIQRFAAVKCGVIVPDPDPAYLIQRERVA
jgi:hypothetical protein